MTSPRPFSGLALSLLNLLAKDTMKHTSLTLLALLVGCSGSDFDAPSTYPVTGKITYNGAPVEGAVVQFIAALEEGGPTAASGKTDIEGKYTLRTAFTPAVEEEGAMAGDYAVVVHKITLPPVIQPISPPAGMSPQEQSEFMAQQAREVMGRQASQPPPKSELPDKYGKKQTTPLEATVTSAGGNFDFELKDE
jgi:hypothetical protein